MPNTATKELQIFGTVLSDLMVEVVLDHSHPAQLRLHTWDGKKTAMPSTLTVGGCTYSAAPIAAGLCRAVRFPGSSKGFGTAAHLTSTMQNVLGRYGNLQHDAAALVVAFALSSWFVDCFPISPVLYLLGSDREATLLLRLMGCFCRRPILLSDVDVVALGTLPRDLYPTLLVNQRDLGRRVTRVLLAANDRHFAVARGKSEIHAYGAKAFASIPELADRAGVRLSLSPALEPRPVLTDSAEKEIAADFQSKLVRFRMVSHQRVSDAEVDTRDFVPTMREAVRAWLAPIYDCPDLRRSVTNSLLQQSQDLQGDRLSDDQCLVAEAALFFCHKSGTEHFFIGDLAGVVNALLKGRHEDRVVSDKKVGLLLRALGIHGQRVVQGYRILLSDAVREQIHRIASAYQVVSVQDRITRCHHCPHASANGKTN